MKSVRGTTSFDLVLGVDAFGEVSRGPNREPLSHAQVIRNTVMEAVLAEQAGLDIFALGEHHREDMPMSAPEVVLAAAAGQTERIRLGSGVTVLSSDDPIRVFQRFSTLDAITNGRAQVILGRGSSVESFPLFGFDLADYEILFEEKLDLFARLLREPRVSWDGSIRPALRDQPIVPRPESGTLDAWVGVGGSPQSVVRAARYGFPLMIAIIGGAPARFAPFAELHRHELLRLGHRAAPVGIHAPGHVAPTDEQAAEEFWPLYQDLLIRLGRERGFRAPTHKSFIREIEMGALFVGSPATVAAKVAATLNSLGATRFDLKYGMGDMPREWLLRTIELFGTSVAPLVRELMGAHAPRTSQSS
jgi:probable LLM family oxidoreductase